MCHTMFKILRQEKYWKTIFGRTAKISSREMNIFDMKVQNETIENILIICISSYKVSGIRRRFMRWIRHICDNKYIWIDSSLFCEVCNSEVL